MLAAYCKNIFSHKNRLKKISSYDERISRIHGLFVVVLLNMTNKEFGNKQFRQLWILNVHELLFY